MSSEFWLWRQVDAERQLIRGLKSPSVFMSPSFRRPWCMGRLYTTDLKSAAIYIPVFQTNFPIALLTSL